MEPATAEEQMSPDTPESKVLNDGLIQKCIQSPCVTEPVRARLSSGTLSPLCLAPPKRLFYCLPFVMSNVTFHFKQGASGDDHSFKP